MPKERKAFKLLKFARCKHSSIVIRSISVKEKESIVIKFARDKFFGLFARSVGAKGNSSLFARNFSAKRKKKHLN